MMFFEMSSSSRCSWGNGVDHVVAGVDLGSFSSLSGERVAGHVLPHQASAHVEQRRLAHRGLAQLAARSAGERRGGARAEAPDEADEARAVIDQLGVREPAAPAAEERHRHERARRDGGDAVDLAHHLMREPRDQPAPLRRRDGVCGDSDLGLQLVERQHLAELHVGAAVFLAQHLAYLEQRRGVFRALLPAGELARVHALFHHPLVADAHRHERDGAPREAERGLDHHVEQAELGREELASPRSPPFEEELQRVAVAEQAADVGVDDGGIEPVALEAAANEEGAGAAEERAYREEREVVARGDDRDHQPVLAQHEREQQVVDVALVAGQEHDRAFAGGLAHPVDPVEVDVDPRVHVVDERVADELEPLQRTGVRRGLQLPQHAAGLLFEDAALLVARAGEVAEDGLQLGALQHLFADAASSS